MIEGVAAVVVTHQRRRLAGELVRSLIKDEGFDPRQVIVVVNGDGGLDDDMLEASVRMVRLADNAGPAGGFRVGLEAAFADSDVRWAYLCEDDVGLFSLPVPRVTRVLELLRHTPNPNPVGAVAAYGRRFDNRGHAANVVPDGSEPFVAADVAAWGATLVARSVVRAGVLPDDEWFFGLEDFDFFCRMRAAGFDLLLDAESARAVADEQTTAGRDAALRAERPVDSDESWRAYYVARNYVTFARRHGRPAWLLWHLGFTARRLQLAEGRGERRAALHGLVDGLRGRLGQHPRYRRSLGERV